MANAGNALQVQSMTIRAAIRLQLRRAYIAKETGNRYGYYEICRWLRQHIRKRNKGLRIYWNA